MAASEILIKILGDKTDFDAAVDGAEAKAQSGKTGIESKFSGMNFAATGAALTAGVTAPIVAGFNSAIGAVVGFNEGMANVATLIPGQAARVTELGDAVKALSEETGKTTADLSVGLYDVISAFGDTSETLTILDINARAATAGLSTTQEAISLTSAVTKAYGDTSAAAIQQVSDLAFQTVTLGQTTFPELAASIGKVTPAAVSMGVSMEELFGFMATFTGVTGSAAEVSTQLNGVLTALLKPTDEMEAALRAVGFTSGQAAVEQLGLKGTMDALFAATGQNQTAFGALFGNVEALRLAFPATSTNAGVLQEKIAAMGNAAGLTNTAFLEQTQGVNAAGFAMKQMDAEIDNAKIALGEALLPAITAVTPILKDLVGFVKAGIDWFKELPGPIQNSVLALGGVLAAAGPVLLAIGGIIALPISGTMVAWAAGIAGAVSAITLLWSESETFRNTGQAVWEMVTGLWNEIVLLGDQLSTLVGGFLEANPQLANFLGFVADVIGTMVNWAAQIVLFLSPLNLLKSTLEATNVVLGAFIDKQAPLESALGKTNKGIADHANEQAAAATALTKTTKETDALTKAIGTGSTGLTGASKKAQKEAEKLRKEQEKLWDITDRNENMMSRLEKQLDLVAKTAGRETKKAFEDTADEAKALNEKLLDTYNRSTDLSRIALPGVVEALGKLPEPIDAGWDAMDKFGLKSADTFAAATADAQRAYDELIQSGRATQFQQDSAYLQLLNVMADETEFTTGNIPIQLQRALEDMNAKVNDPNYGVPALTQSFTAMFGSIGAGLSDISNNALHALIHGDMDSLKDLGGSLKQLGLDALSNFAQPFIDMITGPNGLIKKGLDILLDKIIDVDGALARMIGSAAGSAGNIPGIPGIPGVGGGGGGTGGAGGATGSAGAVAATGIMGVVGAVGSVVSAISGVISNFQLARQENTLNAIEESTRYSKMYLGGSGGEEGHNILTHTAKAHEYLSYVVDDLRGQGAMKDTLWDMASDLGYVLQKIEMEGGLLGLTNSIEASVFWTLKKIEGWDGWIEGTLKSIESNLVAIRETGMKVENHIYLDSREIATVMGESVALQGI